MSFFGDAQEFPALVFSELHVEMLAFYLQFSRLDDVIHFPLKPQTLPHPFWGMEENRQNLCKFFGADPLWFQTVRFYFRSEVGRYHNAIRLRCWLLNLQSRAPRCLNQTNRRIIHCS